MIYFPEGSAVDVKPSAKDSQADHLGAIIPTAKGRKYAYAVYAGVSLLVTNTLIGFSAAQLDAPVWLVVSAAVVANLAAPFSALAIANAKS
jgi:hypothetical protein